MCGVPKALNKPLFNSSAASKNRLRPPIKLRSMSSMSLRNPGKSNAPCCDDPKVTDRFSISSVTSSSVYSLLDCTTSTGLTKT
ncbi:hypothetical protein ACFX13_008852 [Malus domestica]